MMHDITAVWWLWVWGGGAKFEFVTNILTLRHLEKRERRHARDAIAVRRRSTFEIICSAIYRSLVRLPWRFFSSISVRSVCPLPPSLVRTSPRSHIIDLTVSGQQSVRECGTLLGDPNDRRTRFFNVLSEAGCEDKLYSSFPAFRYHE